MMYFYLYNRINKIRPTIEFILLHISMFGILLINTRLVDTITLLLIILDKNNTVGQNFCIMYSHSLFFSCLVLFILRYYLLYYCCLYDFIYSFSSIIEITTSSCPIFINVIVKWWNVWRQILRIYYTLDKNDPLMFLLLLVSYRNSSIGC